VDGKTYVTKEKKKEHEKKKPRCKKRSKFRRDDPNGVEKGGEGEKPTRGRRTVKGVGCQTERAGAAGEKGGRVRRKKQLEGGADARKTPQSKVSLENSRGNGLHGS